MCFIKQLLVGENYRYELPQNEVSQSGGGKSLEIMREKIRDLQDKSRRLNRNIVLGVLEEKKELMEEQ